MQIIRVVLALASLQFQRLRDMKRYVLVLTVLLAQLVMGEDFFWKPKNNWNNPSNWRLDRVPCGGDIASFTSVPDGTTIYLNEDITVQTILLPDNGVIILTPSVAINLGNEADCSGDMSPGEQPTEAAGGGVNEYIGAAPRWWECSENWLSQNNFPTDHPPCGDDRAFFDQGFSSVYANETILVSYLEVRGMPIQSMDELDKVEFPLKININPGCKDNPSLCPCPSDAGCKAPSSFVNLQTSDQGPNIAGIVVGILFATIVIVVIIIVLVIVIVVMYKKNRQVISYTNEDFLEEPAGSKSSDEDQILKEMQPIPKTFENPIYDSTFVPSDIQLTTYESKPEQNFNVPDSQKYKPAGDVFQPDTNDDENFVKVDLSTLSDLDVPDPVEGSDEASDYRNGNEQEKNEPKGKKVSGVGKYERFD